MKANLSPVPKTIMALRPRTPPRPAYPASLPSSSSMRSSWLYFEIRSDRDNEPVLICVARVPTEISAIVLSEVSPDRCEITAE